MSGEKPALDLFGQPASPAIGMIVRLERSIDRKRPCHANRAELHPGRGPHGAELRCVNCDRHRGWLPREALHFLCTTAQRFGAPVELPILRDSSIGDHTMTKPVKTAYDNTNKGALFKNKQKEAAEHPDYQGRINAAGLDYWLSAWLQTSKKGEKYMSLSIKLMDEPTTLAPEPLADELDDALPF